MRDALGKMIIRWMEQNENVLFLAADIGGGLFKNLQKLFPERVINVGIAEQNMIGMAAGLTNLGFRVICYSKACFISLRVADQIKNALCYGGNNVILIGADAGYDEANAGYSHIATEDLGVIRSMAEINVYVPTTAEGMRDCFRDAVESPYPSYIRINKKKVEKGLEAMRTVTGGLYYLKEGKGQNNVIVTQGISAELAMNWSEERTDIDSILVVDKYQGIYHSLISEIKRFKNIIVFEEQFKRNGLYQLITELIIEERLSTVTLSRIGPVAGYERICFDRESKVREEIKCYTLLDTP